MAPTRPPTKTWRRENEVLLKSFTDHFLTYAIDIRYIIFWSWLASIDCRNAQSASSKLCPSQWTQDQCEFIQVSLHCSDGACSTHETGHRTSRLTPLNTRRVQSRTSAPICPGQSVSARDILRSTGRSLTSGRFRDGVFSDFKLALMLPISVESHLLLQMSPIAEVLSSAPPLWELRAPG